jgi:putative ABC transport system permease protein
MPALLVRRSRLEEAPLPQVFLPFAQLPSRGGDIIVRAVTEPLALAAGARRAINAVNNTVPAYQVSTLEQRVDSLLATRRFQALLLSLFAATGVLIAAIGIYGLMRYVMTERKREIGIRMAVGASARDVVVMVLREGLLLSMIGLFIGVVVALGLTGMMRTLVYGVSTTDPLTFAVASLVMVFVAAVACSEPAFRAARVDPLVALRYE